VNDRISHAEPDHVLVDVKAKAFGGLRPALTPTPGAVPEQRAGCRPQDIHKFRSLRLQGIAGPASGRAPFAPRASPVA
jgi:hypothetical protein